MPRTKSDPWADAVLHLTSADPRWKTIVERVGPCALRPRKDRFGTLVRAIVGQQISTKAAASIDAKVRALVGDPHEPTALLAAGEEKLRTCGLSGVKARYVLNLSEAVASDRLPLKRIGTWEDEAIIERMTEIKGIGRWTAEMFLIFALNRPDVLPVLDLGVRVGIRDFHGLDEMPHPRHCAPFAEAWKPYRTVAMWYLWRNIDALRAKTV
jgi:DNA-3-methyladenine glycosylase II